MTGTAHPYMANSAPELREELCAAVGVRRPRRAVRADPGRPHHPRSRSRCRRRSPPRSSSRATSGACCRPTSTARPTLSFLGGGCWQHHVPAVCDELATRTEFLTSVWGTASSDHGRNQAWFEFASQLGELLELDFVALPVYSWGCAAGHAIRMAARLTGTERGAGARVDRPRAARGDPHLLRAAGNGRPHRRAARRDRSHHGRPRPRRARGHAVRAHRSGVLRDARVARRDRARVRADRRACPRSRRRDDRRRRPDLARRVWRRPDSSAPTSRSAPRSRSAST